MSNFDNVNRHQTSLTREDFYFKKQKFALFKGELVKWEKQVLAKATAHE